MCFQSINLISSCVFEKILDLAVARFILVNIIVTPIAKSVIWWAYETVIDVLIGYMSPIKLPLLIAKLSVYLYIVQISSILKSLSLLLRIVIWLIIHLVWKLILKIIIWVLLESVLWIDHFEFWEILFSVSIFSIVYIATLFELLTELCKPFSAEFCFWRKTFSKRGRFKSYKPKAFTLAQPQT